MGSFFTFSTLPPLTVPQVKLTDFITEFYYSLPCMSINIVFPFLFTTHNNSPMPPFIHIHIHTLIKPLSLPNNKTFKNWTPENNEHSKFNNSLQIFEFLALKHSEISKKEKEKLAKV